MRSRPFEEEKSGTLNPDLLLLDPALTIEETQTGCAQAVRLNLASAVVKPCFVRQAADALRGSAVALGTVIGYPHGANPARIKLAEAKRALTEGVVELLLWGNLGLLKAGDLDAFGSDLAGVIGLAHMNGARVRVVIDMDHLNGSEVQTVLAQAIRAGADGAVAFYGLAIDQEALGRLQALIEAAGEKIPVGTMGAVEHPGDLEALGEAGCAWIGLPIENLNTLMAVD
jgi:deoxyribose-phosphate aldolase